MPDRHASPEELLDQWLDALNAAGGTTPPAPAAVADLAAVALDYRRALASSGASASTERNGTMPHALATPNGATWRTLAQPARRRIDWGSWLATAAVFALLVGLVGGAALRTWGLPGATDPTNVAGVAASPGATPAGTLSCASPGYRTVVEGEVDDAELASLGETGTPLNVDGIYFHIPTASGEVVTLPNTWTPIGGPMWSSETTADANGDATIRNVDTGEEWTFVDAGAPFPGVYIPPYLIVPANAAATDFRIIDTESGDEELVSEIRGERFARPARISPIAADYPFRSPTVLMFSFDEAATYPNTGPDSTDPDAEPGALGKNALYLPPNLDDAYFLSAPVFARYAQETAWSSETGRLAYATEIDGAPAIVVTRPDGEAWTELTHDITADDLPLMFSEDGTMLVVSRPGGIVTFDLGEQSRSILASHLADERFMPIAHNAASMNVLVAYPDRHIAIVNAASGEVMDFPDVTVPASTHLPDDPAQRMSFDNDLYELFDDRDGTVRIVNLVAGEVSPPMSVFNPGEQWVDAAYYPQVQYHAQYPKAVWPDGFAYLDPDFALNVVPVEGEAWSIPAPAGFKVDDNQVAHLFTSPSQSCIVLQVMMEAGRSVVSNEGQSTRIVATWIAPLEPGAEWTKLDNAITAWFPTTGDEDEPRTLPAQDFASPAAVAPEPALSCDSPGYRAVVRGEIAPDALALIGATDAIIRGDTTTITAANGTEIEFGPDDVWTVHWNASVILSGESEEALNTVTSLATGDSWTFPVFVEDDPQAQAAFMLIGGPWLIGAVGESSNEWRVINIDTGEERLTSDVFGASFDQGPLPLVAPWLNPTATPQMIAFSMMDEPTAALVLPTGDLDDAWVLPPGHVLASGTGVIASDGGRIAYVRPSPDDGSNIVIVLDGFTGEEIATYPGPETEDNLQTVGLTGDDSTLILRDNRRVWTVDIATGEIATVFDPGGEIHDVAFDPTTGTAIASSGDDEITWFDPASGETTDLDIPVPMRFPQPQFGWVLLQTRDDIAVDYALLDMTTGEIVNAPIGADRDENGTNVWITGGDDTGVYVVQAESGRMLVLDGPSGQAFDLAAPEAGRDGWNGVSIGVSPNGGCLVYTEVGQGEEPGTSWIAPLEPDAEWRELPFELGPWVEMPPAPEALAATPAATPVAFTPDYQISDNVPTFILRAEPSILAEPVESLQPGTPLDYLDEDAPSQSPDDGARWMRVATENGNIGWVRAIDVMPYTEATPPAGPLPPTATAVTADPGIVDMLPDGAIPVVATDDPVSIDQHVFATVGRLGPDSSPGMTIPLRNGEVLKLPDAIAIDQLPRTTVALVTNDDGSRLTIDLTSGDTLFDFLPPVAEGEQWVGHYLLIPARDGTIWRVIDLLTGDQTDTAMLGGGPFDRPVTVVPMSSPADAPRNVVVQFAFEASNGDLMPWQGLATDAGPPSGLMIVPGRMEDARFLEDSMGSVDAMHPSVAISASAEPLVAYTTPSSAAVVVLEDAVSGERIAAWSADDLTQRVHPVYLAGFGADGDTLISWLGYGGYGPAFIHELGWSDGGPEVVSADLGLTNVQEVVAAGDMVFLAVMAEPEDGDAGPARSWKLLDLESGEVTDLPELDGMLLDRHLPGSPWMLLNSFDDPRSRNVVIVDAATGEVTARLDDPNLGVATARSSSRDGGVIVVTGHTGDVHTTGYVIDAASGEAWALEPPFEGQVWYGVSPDGSLLTASTDAGDGWIAQVEEGAAWSPLPGGNIVAWLSLPDV